MSLSWETSLPSDTVRDRAGARARGRCQHPEERDDTGAGPTQLSRKGTAQVFGG